MSAFVLSFKEIDKTKLDTVGGKGANLGELSRINGINVPDGFCITTEAYKRIISGNEVLNALLNQLSGLKVESREEISRISSKIRKVIEEISIPTDIEKEIANYLSKFGEKNAYAVRSSATAEDLPLASFAGQQDTYLNIMGKDSILEHVSKCWASLFTDRAVIYRIQNSFEHSKVFLSVVVQQMVFPQASGIMFTADPISYNRKVMSIDASFGLGEALVSGLVNADIYKVREGEIIDKKISTKKLAIYGLKEGGTKKQSVESARQNTQTLSDEQILQLEGIGRNIEAYFSNPQDIEWCFYENRFYIVQSRPITTLYPAPNVNDGKNHVYISFGHRQMMTEAMKPMGLTFFQDFFKLISGSVMPELGGRLYMDISNELSSPLMRKSFIKSMDMVDILIQKAIINLMKRKDFTANLYKGKTAMVGTSTMLNWGVQTIRTYLKNDPGIVENLIAHNEAVMYEMEKRFAALSGEELFDVIAKSYKEMKETIFKTYGAVFAGAFSSS